MRDAWGFDGYITSDCGAVNDVYAQHKYLGDKSKVAKAVLEAGMDSDWRVPGCQHAGSNRCRRGDQERLQQRSHNMFMVRMRSGTSIPRRRSRT